MSLQVTEDLVWSLFAESEETVCSSLQATGELILGQEESSSIPTYVENDLSKEKTGFDSPLAAAKGEQFNFYIIFL